MKYGKRYHHPMEWWTLTSVESSTVCGVPSSSTTASHCGKMNSLSSKCYFVFTILSIWLSLCLIKSNILLMVTSFLCLSSNRSSAITNQKACIIQLIILSLVFWMVCFTSIFDWSRILLPAFQPMKYKTETNRDLVTRFLLKLDFGYW